MVVVVAALVGVGVNSVGEYSKGGLGRHQYHLLGDWTSHLSPKALLYRRDGPLLVVRARDLDCG